MSRSNTCSTGAVERGNCRISSERRHSTKYRNAKHAHHDSKGTFHAPKRPVREELNNVPNQHQRMEQEDHSKDHHRSRHDHRHHDHNHHQLRKRIVDGAKLSAKLMAAVVFCAVAPILYVVIPPAHDAGDRA